ncbi:leucine-rich repeat- and IQ domain-containing protein 1 isoform X1 [Pogona vitticeps]
MAMEENYDDAEIEEEIELELSQISFSSFETDDPNSDVSLEASSDSEPISDELPESVHHYLDFVRGRSQNAERLILQDLENGGISDDIYSVVPKNASEHLAVLASEYNEDPEELKRRVLSEIDEEEEEQISEAPDNTIEPNNSASVSSSEPTGGDDDDVVITLTFQEVEERCKQEYQHWVEKQKDLEYETIKYLKAQREIEAEKRKEEEKRRELRQEELEAERIKLEKFHEQQQAKMEEELLKEEEVWKEQLRGHKELISNLHIQIEEEKRMFEEKQAIERQWLAEQQTIAAVKIQATFRAFMVYKKYAPMMKQWRAELDRKRELKEAMEREMKEKQERWRKRALEKKEQEEKERRQREEKKREEHEEKMKRREVYEKKKELMRLHREQLKLGELNQEEKGKIKLDTEEKTEFRNMAKEIQIPRKEQGIKNIKENETEKIEKKVDCEHKDEDTRKTNKEKTMKRFEELNKVNPARTQRGVDSQNTDGMLGKGNKDKEIKTVKEQEADKRELNIEKEEIHQKMDCEHKEDTEKTNEEKAMEKEELQEVNHFRTQKGVDSQNTGQMSGKQNKEKEIKKVEEEEHEYNGLNIEKEQKNQTEEIKYEEVKQAEKHGMHGTLQCDSGVSENGEQKSGKEENLNERNSKKSVENDLKFHVATLGCQKNSKTDAFNLEIDAEVNLEISFHKNDINSNIQLDSGDSGKIFRPYTSENVKAQLAEKVHEEAPNHWVKGENSVKTLEQTLLLSDSIEKKRLAWMKTCKSWSRIYSEHQRKKTTERSKQRKCSTGLMPPLSAAMIIQASPSNALQQVTTITFQDLPGCSLSTLSQCSKLQFLSLRCCGLLALEGLSNCKDLKYINVEENNIHMINCENLENLCILILNKNNISSLHGLYGCCNLQNLELSYNKITRIGGLESLKNLQRLVMDHNQLINTKGLSDVPTLIYIDCSFNHLTHIEGIENCGLLQILKLHGNNLNEFPSLENHVLLRELYLEDNSISTLEKLSLYWLPLLRILFLSKNSLLQLAPLFSCVSLEKLDISNNCLLELKSVIQWLNGCNGLRELSLYGNPMLQEENWRCTLLKSLPSLKILNDENVISDAEIPSEETVKRIALGSFASFCQTQIQEIDLISNKTTMRLINGFSEDDVQRQCWYFKKLMTLSSEHRYAHEYGVLNTTKGEEVEKQTNHLNQEVINTTEKNNSFITGVKENMQDLLSTPERWITSGNAQSMSVNSFMTVPTMRKMQECQQKKKMLQCILDHTKKNKENNALFSLKENEFSEQVAASNRGNYFQHFDKNLAATVIQSYWRGYTVRKAIHYYRRLHLAATVIQSFWRSYMDRKKIASGNKESHHFMSKNKAAIILQALWKGFRLRKKLSSALAAVKSDEAEEDYKEINVDDFIFDETVIEEEWPALESTHFLSQTPLSSDQKHNETARCENKPHHLTHFPHNTWQVGEKTKSFLLENSQISKRSEKNAPSQFSTLRPLKKSVSRMEKEEEISEEWGFKDISTAQLMLRRAHKMKAKKSSSRNLDPAVRLALFKNNENKHPPVKPPKKAQTAKTGYFEGKEGDYSHTDTSAENLERSRERTYQWLHTQVWDYEGPSPQNEKRKHFLPEIDPEILKGGQVQLVTSPVRREDTDLELVSMTSASTLTQNREKNNQPHRHSAESSRKDAPAPERSHLGPSHKERISFRDHPVRLSSGWGSGKKKAKALK